MKLKILTAALALLASLCISQSASAYVAVTGVDPATSTASGIPPVGATLSVMGGDFTSYVPTDPGDPTVPGGDLSPYRYNISVTVQSISGATEVLDGTYQIFDDTNHDGTFDPGDSSISSGTADLLGTLDAQLTGGTVTGTLTQTAGPSQPGFPSLSSPATLAGAYVVTSPDSGLFQATLTSVPEPSTWVAIASGAGLLLGSARLRRRV